MPISMREVAATAGVSESTVSLVLNNKKGTRIPLETQRRVRQVAKEMDYRPNSFARSMARQRTNTIRLITPSHENPFFVHVSKAVDSYTRKSGYKLWVDATLDERLTYAPGEEVGVWPVDGALIWANDLQDLADFLGGQADEIPVVYLGFQGHGAVDAVTFDVYAGGRQIADYLVARGYRRIAYVVPPYVPEFVTGHRRVKAYEDVCREMAIPVEYIRLAREQGTPECMVSLRAGMEIAARPASERPDAVIGFNDTIAFGLYQGFRRARIQVPNDIAVVGFDGGIVSQCLDRPLTTIAIPVEEICRKAVDLLIQRIQGDKSTPLQSIVLPTDLLIGDTT